MEENAEEEEEAPVPPPAKNSNPTRQGKKRETRVQRLPDNLPVREEKIIPLAVQAEPEAWRQMGEEVTDQLEKEPGYLYVRRMIRLKFVKIDAPHQPPVMSPAPPSLIPGGFYGPSLLAGIALDKFLSPSALSDREALPATPRREDPAPDEERQPRPDRELGLAGGGRHGT
ncbi:MAG: hypothetical protein ACKV19_11490 [Verrucomicrobiales bacterium]